VSQPSNRTPTYNGGATKSPPAYNSNPTKLQQPSGNAPFRPAPRPAQEFRAPQPRVGPTTSNREPTYHPLPSSFSLEDIEQSEMFKDV
jgi:hypothetical protein